MKDISVMIKPASSLCNMKCKYCFYSDIAKVRQTPSYGRMEKETAEKLLGNIRVDLKPGDRICFVFQGGEPTLAGLDFYRYFVKLVNRWEKGIEVSYALQTNGLCLDQEWCEFLARHRFLVGISLDILPLCHDEARIDQEGQGTFRRVLNAIHLMEEYKIEYNVLCTLTGNVARHPQKVWKTITKYDFKWVQFTPCLDGLSESEGSSYALKPQEFASFYIQLFACWFSDYQKGAYRSIKLIDDIINYLVCKIPTACGLNGECQPQLIVEADGSTFPCDFYCTEEYLLGNFTVQTWKELFQRSLGFGGRKREEKEICKKCPYETMCGGGCRRMQKEMYCGKESSYCGMQAFLQYSMPELLKIADILSGKQKSGRKGES